MSVRSGIGRHGQPVLEIDCRFGTATIYVQGAHLTSWVPAGGDEMLFVSKAARFAPGESIRGGVPIAFPQFAELGPLPLHGFAHRVPWEAGARWETGAALTLLDSAATRALWPQRFHAELAVDLAADALHVRFTVRNTDVRPLEWSGTLHTFLTLDARHTAIRGLGPAWFVDRGHGSRLTEDAGAELRIARHTDRAYLDTGPQVEVNDGRRRLVVAKTGFRDTVVWNPGAETSGRFPDLRPDDHARFVCIEAAEVRAVPVAAGGAWSGGQRVRIAAS